MAEGRAASIDPIRPSFARLRIALSYLWRHGRLPEIAAPSRFTEFVQRSKLVDRDQRMREMADKLHAKAVVARVLGPHWVVPTLWSGTRIPDSIDWPRPFVLKARHACNRNLFVRGEVPCAGALRRRTRRWTASGYGGWLDEWAYAGIEPGLLAEPFIGIGGVLPVDYKFYVFGGRVEFVQVHLDREHRHRWIVLDRRWRRIPGCRSSDDPAAPPALTEMVAAAEALAGGFAFVRVDLYQPADRPLFGEMTFYPGSGLDPFDPPHLDATMGALWRAALG